MDYDAQVCSLQEMKSLYAEAMAVPAKAWAGKEVEIFSVDELRNAGKMASLMEVLMLRGCEFEGKFVLRRVARADALLVSFAEGLLRDFVNNPSAPNIAQELLRMGWKISNVSRIHGHRLRVPTRRVPRQPMLNRLGKSLRRLAGFAYKKKKPLEYIQRRLRELHDHEIPRIRSTQVLLGYPVTPSLPAPALAIAPAASSPSSSASSWVSLDSFNSACSSCMERLETEELGLEEQEALPALRSTDSSSSSSDDSDASP